eukprot:CAMPEP_0185037270 /NCGR_PEP_ID=MMETSP1103-20130426/31430_1 /TAXON_ID=36769 /ORGANISM="Paraphysomonas bandaiensis, Strain Caron Lab Isolate" /LENGTH=166 /DNA_ID=CAMNT_0027575169 /DNA_START=31 /DNA_END=528 /DNA_ORIENTATION=+
MQNLDVRDRVLKLLSIKKTIRSAVRQSKSVVEIRDRVDYKAVISLGDLISNTIYAPKDYRPGMPLLSGYPPAPQLENMRKGRLGSTRLDIVSFDSSGGELSSMINEELVMAAQIPLVTHRAVDKSPPVEVEKRPAPDQANPEDNVAKKARNITIDFGFETDDDEAE